MMLGTAITSIVIASAAKQSPHHRRLLRRFAPRNDIHHIVTFIFVLALTACKLDVAPSKSAAPGKPATAAAPPAGAVQLTGAGATFPYPLYAKWFYTYRAQHPNIAINYQSIGSGAGIQQLLAGTVDFGASDAPMNDKQLAQSPSPVVHIPTTLGAVVAVFHLACTNAPIRLRPATLAHIYLGDIKRWNDERLLADNPALATCDLDIIPVYRSDGSGTTYIFTEYLAKVSSDWKTKVGNGKAVRWPVGLGGKGNEGVTGMVKLLDGTIGYVELTFAAKNNLPFASLQNARGEFITPSLLSVTNAVPEKIPDDMRVSITNSDAAGAYPISAFTYLLIAPHTLAPEKRNVLREFIRWAMRDGQEFAPDLHYAPLPEKLRARVETLVTAW